MLLRNPLLLFVTFSSLLVSFETIASCQSQFDSVQTLIQQLEQDRKNLSEITDPKKLSDEKAHYAERTKSLPGQVEELLTKGIVDYLNNGSGGSPLQLQKDLRGALRSRSDADDSGNSAYVFRLGGQAKPSYLVAYNLTYCAICSSSWVGIIGPEKGAYSIVSSLKDPLPNQSVNVAALGELGDRSAVFLIYGTLWGDAHRRMNLIAYSASSEQLKKVWSLSDLVEGELAVNGPVVIVKSYTTLRPPFTYRTEVYSLTVDGVVLQSSSESPAN